MRAKLQEWYDYFRLVFMLFATLIHWLNDRGTTKEKSLKSLFEADHQAVKAGRRARRMRKFFSTEQATDYVKESYDLAYNWFKQNHQAELAELEQNPEKLARRLAQYSWRKWPISQYLHDHDKPADSRDNPGGK